MVNILDLFSPDEIKQKSDGDYKTECPCCGLQGGRTRGLILFTKTDTWFCQSSRRHGGPLELVAMQSKLINCIDCCETGEKRRVLEGDLFKETLDHLREDYGEEVYEGILEVVGLKISTQLPNDGILVSEFADTLATRFKKEDLFFYRSDTKEIVEIGKIVHADGGYEYKGFISMTSNRFVSLIERYFRPWAKRYTKSGVHIVNKSLSPSIANIVLVSDNFRHSMPVINRIFSIQQPIIHEGKLTFPKIGYDKRFGSWLSQTSPKISKPDMKLKDAKKIIDFIMCEFCFQDEQDRVNAIAGLLTPYLRGLYTSFNMRTPVFIYEANRERAGKDYLAGISGIIYEGSPIEDPPISNNENSGGKNDELRKKILSAMMTGRKRMHFANNKGYLNNAVFEYATTSTSFTDRILGSNNIAEFDNEIEYSLSGNLGMRLTPDLTNRARFIKLFLDIEDANAREFKNRDLQQWVTEHREDIISALYCLVRDWIENNSPKGTLPFTSYPQWASICGGIMENAGYGNPCVPDKEMLGVASDTETNDMKALFELCYEEKPDEWIKKIEIKDIVKDSDSDIFTYVDWDKKKDQINFGIKLNRFIGRILTDIRMIIKPTEGKVRGGRQEFKFVKQTSTIENLKHGQKSQREIGHDGHDGHDSTHVKSAIGKVEIEECQNIPNIANMTKPQKEKILDSKIQFRDAEECKEENLRRLGFI